MDYDAIFQWKMTPPEAEAYKFALYWCEEAHKVFPKAHVSCLPKKGDPRKSLLFKHCWKLLRTVKGLLKPEEVPLYIHAQLYCMKKFDGYVGPNCLSGDKAWIRWKVYKYLYEQKLAERENRPPPLKANPAISKELILTKKFIFEKCDGDPTQEKIEGFFNDGFFKLWSMKGHVSAYYLMLSPWLKKHIKKLSFDCNFDPKLVEGKLTPDVVEFFRHEFDYEI